MSDLIDNRSSLLSESIGKELGVSASARFAVGYFFVSGIETVADSLRNIGELRLLIGNTTNRATIEQIAEGYRRLDMASKEVEDEEFINRRESEKRTERTAYEVGNSLEVMDQTDEGQRLVKLLVRMIEDDRLKVRVYTKGTMHAKAYIFDHFETISVNGNEVPNPSPGVAIIGSSNFTVSGITSNTEMNVYVHGGENHAQLGAWFDELWEEAEDFDTALMREISQSWAGATPTPYQVYMKALYELVKDRLEGEKDTDTIAVDTIIESLADFQRVAFRQAVGMIREHGGAFVSDVVGLGKSYIGSAIVKYFEQVESARPLIICPKSLVEMWETYNEAYELNARVLSMSRLLEGRQAEELVGGNILLDDVKYRDRDFLLVDESHNFRNTDTQRYRLLDEFMSVGGKRLCMLTATPRNKSAWDVFSQMKLFQRPGRLTVPAEPDDLREYFKLIEKQERQLPDLLSHVLVRRTRNHVLRWYGRDSETDERVDPNAFEPYLKGERRAYVVVDGNKQFFPKRRLKTVEYSIEDTYNGLYEELRGYLGHAESVEDRMDTRAAKERARDDGALTYGRYGIGDYLLPGKENDSRYAELRRTGTQLRGLIRVLMFKRFESSVEAFRQTVGRLLAAHRAFTVAVEGGKLPSGKGAERILNSFDLGGDEEAEEELLKALGDSDDAKYETEDFDVDGLLSDVGQDIGVLEKMLSLVEAITPVEDDKLQTLKGRLARDRMQEGKVLIFTQYADTARYLYENLNPDGGRDDIDVIFSGDKSKERAVGRFSPGSNPEFKRSASDTELSMLIATDVLSEGLNLQDCDKIINYDLHWNPVRLIQRFGRIDRIGTAHEEVFGYNFLPETGIEENLGLQEQLSLRIKEIQETIGEDSAILDSSERVNHTAMYAIYQADEGEAESIAQAEGTDGLFGDEPEGFVDLGEAVEMFRQMRDERPEEFDEIVALRDGIRSSRSLDEGGGGRGVHVFCRSGNHQRFYRVEVDAVEEITTQQFLAALRCEPGEAREKLPDGYNDAVTRAKTRFDNYLGNVSAKLLAAPKLPDAQKYIVNRLREIHGKLDTTEERRRRIERLDESLRYEANLAVLRKLREIKRERPEDGELLARLERVYVDYRLDRAKVDAEERISRLRALQVPRIVCSESVL